MVEIVYHLIIVELILFVKYKCTQYLKYCHSRYSEIVRTLCELLRTVTSSSSVHSVKTAVE